MENFFVKDSSATTWVRILKFGTKLDSDELYCVRKEQPHIAYQSLYLFIFLSLQLNISVTDFSAPIGASVFKFCLHLQDGKVYCVNGKTATYCLSVPLFVHFSFSPMENFFVKDSSATTWVRILKFGTKLDSDELYCVRKEQPHIAYQSLYLFIFLSLQLNISVTDFSAPIGASVFKFCLHLQDGKVYCVNGN